MAWASGGLGLTGEEGQEALGAGVDDVDLVQGHGVHHLLALLELPVRALHELGLRGGAGTGVEMRAEKGTEGDPRGLCLGETGAPWKGAGNPDGVTPRPRGQEVVEARHSRALKNMRVPGRAQKP